MSSQKGVFTVSLDFELYWGLRDIFSLKDCREGIEGERRVIPELLHLFGEYGIHATWATVGFLFYPDKRTLLNGLPEELPSYNRVELNPYESINSIGKNEQDDPFHFAHSIIKEIAAAPYQEIASHTFSHYYCLEHGQSKRSFRSDLVAAKTAANSLGIELKSIVFPRNQCNSDYLDVCRELGFISYRGNPRSWIYRASANGYKSIVKKISRLSDSYLNISGTHCYELNSLESDGIVEVPASKFLRPFSPQLSVLEPLKLKRITEGMSAAAERGMLYHLWWHPYNFGTHTAENMESLHKILSHFKLMEERHGMRSMSMAEFASQYVRRPIELENAHV